MDIRLINSRRQIINASKLSIMAEGKYIVGLTAEGKQVLIDTCEDEANAKETIDFLIARIDEASESDKGSMVLYLY